MYDGEFKSRSFFFAVGLVVYALAVQVCAVVCGPYRAREVLSRSLGLAMEVSPYAP